MSTNNNPRFQVLTPAMMKEFEKEELAAQEAARNPQIEDEEATPQTPASPDSASEELAVLKKRYSDLKSTVDSRITKERQIAEATEKENRELKELLAKQNAKRYASPEDIQKFESEYTVSPILKQLASDVTDERVKEAVDLIRKELRDKDLEQERINRDVAKLTKSHPDWAELQENAIFLAWLDKQSITVQNLADYAKTKDMDGAIAVLDLFKAGVKVKPSGSNSTNLSTNPVKSKAEIPTPRDGQLSLATWEKEYDAVTKRGDSAKQAKLMEKMELAYAEGRLIP